MGLFSKLTDALSGPSVEEIAQQVSDPDVELDVLKKTYVEASSKSDSECCTIDMAIASNPNCPKEILEDLLDFWALDFMFNHGLAENTNTPSNVLAYLVDYYKDSDEKNLRLVAETAAKNPNYSA